MVADDTAATSLRFMHAYLSWATARRLARLDQDDAAYVRYAASRDLLLSSLTARIPESGQARSEDEQREGLSEEQRRALTSTVETHSATNPWVDPKAKVRNQLISLWLLHLGLRGGELLSIRIDDIDFRQNVVSVVRRPDAADDPRRRQPLVKTRGRSLPIDCVASLTQHYIFEVRRVLPEARKHPFLFVEVKRGRPMSYSALTKIFAALKACDGIPPSVTPHVMRHTWNDAFSAAMDTSKTPEPAERSMRAFLQGWAPGSETAAVYTRRHVRERARSALVRLQAEMVTRVPK